MAQIPDSLLNDLRCLRCREFLSCGPVSILDTGDSLCGRCYIKGSTAFKAVAYEAVAAYFLFRCKNWARHCAYLLNWNDVLEHEEHCGFGGCCSIFCHNPGALFKSENKLDFTQEITVFNIPEQILQMLTCSLCEYYLSSPPIFVNADGKNTCHRCFASRGHILPIGFVRHAALEKILTMMLFPCIYRNRGCTKFFRFGSDTTFHEKDCSYGQVQRRLPKRFTDSAGKERGVIETHSGHTWGTITPNSQFFVAQEKISIIPSFRVEPIKVVPSEAQGIFFKQLMNHRENLVEHRWRNSRLNDDVFYPTSYSRSNSEKITTPTSNYNNNITTHYNNYVKSSQLEEFSNSNNSPITREPSITRIDSHRSDFYIDEGFNSIDSGSRKLQSYSSTSESPKTPDTPRSSVYASVSSPIKLNPGDLSSLSYFDKFDRTAQRKDSVFSDGRPSTHPMHYNGSFRN